MTELLPLLATTVALTSSGIFAGYTWALSHASIPSIVSTPDPHLSAAWRTQYLAGFYVSRPLCFLNALAYGYLARRSPSATARALHVLAALLTASGVPYALTFLRRTNGALSIRAKKVAGEGEDPRAMALTYAVRDRGSIERERSWGTGEMVRRWQWHNSVRTAILVVGTVLGAVAVGIDAQV